MQPSSLAPAARGGTFVSTGYPLFVLDLAPLPVLLGTVSMLMTLLLAAVLLIAPGQDSAGT